MVANEHVWIPRESSVRESSNWKIERLPLMPTAAGSERIKHVRYIKISEQWKSVRYQRLDRGIIDHNLFPLQPSSFSYRFMRHSAEPYTQGPTTSFLANLMFASKSNQNTAPVKIETLNVIIPCDKHGNHPRLASPRVVSVILAPT